MMVVVSVWEVIGITTTVMLVFTGLALIAFLIGIKIGERSKRKEMTTPGRKR